MAKNENLKNQFKTKYGKHIEFIEGYKDIHQDLFIDSIARPSLNSSKQKINYKGWVNDLFTYSIMIDMFENSGLKNHFKRALDIGGAEGVLSRLLKAEKKVDIASCIEIQNKQDSINTFIFLKYYLKYRVRILLSKFKKLRALAPGNKNKYGYFTQLGKYHANRFRIKSLPKINNYILGDIFEHNKKYDLITSIQSLTYFDLDEIFNKVSDLLVDEGIFFVLVDYFWYPVNSTRIVGDAPFMVQRLEKDDLLEYFAEFHPNMKQEVEEKLNFFHKGNRPVISDFIKTANKYNLQLINYRRHTTPMQDSNIKTKYTPTYLDKHKNTKLSGILEDIRQYNKDVEIEDLLTTHISIIFRKTKQIEKFEIDSNWENKTKKESKIYEKIGKALLS